MTTTTQAAKEATVFEQLSVEMQDQLVILLGCVSRARRIANLLESGAPHGDEIGPAGTSTRFNEGILSVFNTKIDSFRDANNELGAILTKLERFI